MSKVRRPEQQMAADGAPEFSALEMRPSNAESIVALSHNALKQLVTTPQSFADRSYSRWQDSAACLSTDPEAFFPERGHSPNDAKKVCLSCDVKAKCLDYALANNEQFGIWGGTTEDERKKLKSNARRNLA